MDERAEVLTTITSLAVKAYDSRRELKKRVRGVYWNVRPSNPEPLSPLHDLIELFRARRVVLHLNDSKRKFWVDVNGYHRRVGIIHVSAMQEVGEAVRFSIENAQVGTGAEKNYGAWMVAAKVDGGSVRVETHSHYEFEPFTCCTTLGGVVHATYRIEGRRLLLVRAGLCETREEATSFPARRDEWVCTLKEVPQEVEATEGCFRIGAMHIPIELFDPLPFVKRLRKNFEEFVAGS